MGEGQLKYNVTAPMRSLVNWALRGLVIERPSYAYELAQRFERTYGDALALSSISHVYTALGTLKERELVEEIPGTREGRQPKPHYKATEHGIGEYESWLAGQIDEDRQRQRIFVVQLAALARHPDAALKILERYEQACLDEARATALPAERRGNDGAPELLVALGAEESRLAVGAKLAWVRYAREQLQSLASPPGR